MQANQQHVPLNLTVGVHEPWGRPIRRTIDECWTPATCADRCTVLEQWAHGKEQLWDRLTRENAQLFADTAPIGAMMDMMTRMIEDIEWLKAQVRLLATP
jgi:hypothetical protein